MDATHLLTNVQTAGLTGSVVETAGLMVTVADFPAPVGALVEIGAPGEAPIAGEIIGFRGRLTMVSPFGNLSGVRRGKPVRMVRTKRTLRVGPGLLGRVVNAHGTAIDGRPRPALSERSPLDRDAPAPINRPPIDTPLVTGVRAIDTMLTCGLGQRLGIFAGSGVGKSTMLGMMARNTTADVIVIGLIGERGREVNEFIQRDLGEEGLARSVVVVATSNEPPLMRAQAAGAATAIAEYFRDQGKNVLLLLDSITRVALASRELGLSAGEPPTTRGYPPSTFSLLPRLVERAGQSEQGSITGFYSVLVEGDDPNEPIVDSMRGLLDGHIWLSRKNAAKGLYPSIDMTESISRLMNEVTTPEQQGHALLIRRMIAALEENEDLISIGAYRRGANPIVDAAIQLRGEIESLISQKFDQQIAQEEAVAQLGELATKAFELINNPKPSVNQQSTATPQAVRTAS
jgi:flagellum-specific ATP synthase